MSALTLSQLENMLRINKHRLDDELESQADVSYRIGETVARMNSGMLEAKDALAKIEGKIFMELKSNGEKISNDAANAEVLNDPARIKAFRELQTWRQDHEKWVAMNEAWKARGFALKTLADLHLGSYYAVSAAGSTKSPTDYRATYTAGRSAQQNTIEESKPARRRIVREL